MDETQLAEEEFERFEAAGQGHVFAFWQELTSAEREELLRDTAEVDLSQIRRLLDTLVSGKGEEAFSAEGLEPAPYIPHPDSGGDPVPWEQASAVGERALREGKVAAFTVAGGQGTRLGFDGPKGTFPVTPVRKRPLFAVFAEKLLAAQRRYGCTLPWFIMTSSLNHEQTLATFEKADYFGLDAEQVSFFRQGRMPAVDFAGRILLAAKNRLAMSPDGHGGSLRALVRSGAIDRMHADGIKAISYFQVDNPLVRAIDPAFIGFHLGGGSEMSSKMVSKAFPEEKVGHFCRREGTTFVVEYSDMPKAPQEERDSTGKLRFLAGSIAIHVLDVNFVQRLGGKDSSHRLPFHRADKKIAAIDDTGRPVNPDEPNGVKFEQFVFDALPQAANPVIVETRRESEFSPVKNAEGIDSPESCRNDQLRQWTRWLRDAGVEITTDASGLPPFAFEISPLFADSREAFVEKWASLAEPPEIDEGTVLA